MVIRRWVTPPGPVASRLSADAQITLFCINAANIIEAE
jgi:hypothetical protein